MRCALVGLLILLFTAASGAETLPPASTPPAAASADLARTLALLAAVDPQTLPVDQRLTLYFALTDALIADGQQERALTFLTQAALTPAPTTALQTDQPIRTRLEQVASPVLLAALHAGSSLAPLLQAELRRRGEPLPELPAGERVVGVLLPLSGQGAPFGQAVQRGLELARASAATPSSLRFLYADTAADAAALPRLVEELAARPEVLALIGPLLSGDADTAAALAQQLQIPLLLLAQREGTTGGYVFRNALTVSAQVQTLGEFAASEGLRQFAVLHPATRHGEFCADQFRVEVESRGGQLVARQSYPAGAVDLRQPLEALAKEARRLGGGLPDALFIPDGARQVAQIIPQLGFSRLDQLQLLGLNDWNDAELGRMAGPLSEGAIFVAGFFAGSPWPEVSEFVARFQAAYSTAPNILNAQGYDAGRILATLLARPEVGDRDALRQALGGLRDFPGVTSRTRFRLDGEAEKTLFLLQVQDGTLVQIN